MASVYTRVKNETGHWRYHKIKEGRGQKTGHLAGPFFIRPTVKGKQIWHKLGAETFEAAKAEAAQACHAIDAARRGLTVAEADALRNQNRVPIRVAVDTYLKLKGNKTKKTISQYRLTLNVFAQTLATDNVRFVDEITEDALRNYKNFMEGQGFAGKTIHTRIGIVNFLLKKNGVKVRLPKDELPTVDEEPAVPYSDEELRKLWAAIEKVTTGTTKKRANAEIVNGKVYAGPGFGAAIRYKFFLGTAARDKEVTYAAWADINFENKTYHIRSKKDVGFTVKSHESRVVPIPDSLVNLLKERRKNAPHERWIFVNEDGRPDNHFLRKLKVIALRGGLNCGQCKTKVTKGRYEKYETEVTCKTDPICEHWILHRFRKTCATRWASNGASVRTIQHWLGHKDLNTTQIYLGVASSTSPETRLIVNRASGD